MLDTKFKQLLSEVSDWHTPLPDNDPRAEPNPTYPPELTRVKCQSKSCEDCGIECPTGRRVDIRQHRGNGNLHWRQRCLNCGMVKDPFTGLFTLSPQQAHSKWAQFVRDFPRGKKASAK